MICFLTLVCMTLLLKGSAQNMDICGSPSVCYCFTFEPYTIDCSNRGLDVCPAFDIFRRRLTYALYLNNNGISEVPSNYFEDWFSLNTVDLRGNEDFNCSTLSNIREGIENVISDCPAATTSSRSSATGEHYTFKKENLLFGISIDFFLCTEKLCFFIVYNLTQ